MLSGIGSQFTTVAMAWQIYELTDSALQIGLLGLLRAVPQMILLLFAGLLADAINRRKLMMFTQTGLFCVSIALALLTFAGKASPELLYAATIFLAFFTALEQPSRQSMIPNLVPREHLAQSLAPRDPALRSGDRWAIYSRRGPCVVWSGGLLRRRRVFVARHAFSIGALANPDIGRRRVENHFT